MTGPEKPRVSTGTWDRRKLGRIVTEFMVIVVGVLAALAVDAWWSDREENRLEREYLAAFLEDVRVVRAEVDRLGARQSAEMDRVRVMVDSVRSGHSVAASISGAENPPLIYLVRVGLDTYSDLQASGGTTIIEDPEVRRALATLAGQLEFHRRGERWVLDVGIQMRASALQSEGPMDLDRQEWALRSFLLAMELLQDARSGVREAADAAEGILVDALR